MLVEVICDNIKNQIKLILVFNFTKLVRKSRISSGFSCYNLIYNSVTVNKCSLETYVMIVMDQLSTIGSSYYKEGFGPLKLILTIINLYMHLEEETCLLKF